MIQSYRWHRVGAWIALVVVVCRVAQAAAEEKPDTKQEASAAHMRQMKERADAIGLEYQDRPIGLLPDPLLRFDGPDAKCFDGAIWAADNGGRPACLVVMERYPDFWSHELVSLACEPLTAKLATSGRHWSPRCTGFEVKPLPDPTAPADVPPRRLHQMREIARRFEFEDRGEKNELYQLRLLPQPIHRYGSADDRLVDGTFFVFAYGTNPQALLVIELHADKDGNKTWHYGCARVSGHTVLAKLDGKQVFSAAAISQLDPEDPYTFFQVYDVGDKE
jgi:hypothetical protein